MRISAKAKAGRFLAVPALLLLGACGSMAPGAVDATQFRNSRTGAVTEGCGPMQGVAGPLEKAQQGCISAYQSKGWQPLTGAVAQAP